MWHTGSKYRNGNVAYKKKEGIRYSSKRAVSSPEAWTFANDLYFNMLRAAGMNVGLISAVLFWIVVLKAGHGWVISFSLLVVQLLGGILLPRIVTEMILRRNFDKLGMAVDEEAHDEEDDENEGDQD